MISPNIMTRNRGQQRIQKRGSNSITRKAFVTYLIANSCTIKNTNCPIAANGFGFNSPVTNYRHPSSNVYTQHASNLIRYTSLLSRSSRIGMGPSSDDDVTNDSMKGDNASTNENEDKRRRRFGRSQSRSRRNSLGTEKQKLRKWYKDHAPDNDTSGEGGSQSSSSARNPRAKMKKPATSTYSSLLPPPIIGKGSSRRRWENNDNAQLSRGSRSSNGKPPEPIKGETAKQSRQLKTSQSGEGTYTAADSTTEKKSESSSPPPFSSTSKSGRSTYLPPPSSKITGKQSADLPEWGALFASPSQYDTSSNFPTAFPTAFPTPAIEGVLPVSELFYRSTQSLSASEGDDEDDDEKENESSIRAANKRRRAKSYKNAETDGALGDDEELPFSAEQSDRLSTPGNKIQIRRNKAADTSLLLDEIATGIGMGMDGNRIPSEAVRRELTSMARQEREEQRQLERRAKQQQNTVPVEETVSPQNNTEPSDKFTSEASSKSGKLKLNKKKQRVLKGVRVSGRKMVRRGMEMLVGGEPINADPPQRAIELNYYNKHPRLWNRAITLNSPDFGPLLHMHSAGKISKSEVGLYCENFVHNALKWNICPDDLKIVVNKYELRIRNDNAAAEHASSVDSNEGSEKSEAHFTSIQLISYHHKSTSIRQYWKKKMFRRPAIYLVNTASRSVSRAVKTPSLQAARVMSTTSPNETSFKVQSISNEASKPYIPLYHHQDPSLFPPLIPGSLPYMIHNVTAAFEALVSLASSEEARDRFLSIANLCHLSKSGVKSDVDERNNLYSGCIINTNVIGQSDMGFINVFSLFDGLSSLNMEGLNFDIKEFMDGAGFALDRFHEVDREFFLSLKTKEVGQDYDFIKVAKSDPDSLEHTIMSMTTPSFWKYLNTSLREYFDVAPFMAEILKKGTPAKSKITNLALLHARVAAIEKPAADNEDAHPSTEDDSYIAQIVTQLEVLYEREIALPPGVDAYNIVANVATFEACIRGDPNGEQLQWRLCQTRPASEFDLMV